MQINGDSIIGDLLDKAPQSAAVLESMGLLCLGCPASNGETIHEACTIHEIPEEELLTKLRTCLAIEP